MCALFSSLSLPLSFSPRLLSSPAIVIQSKRGLLTISKE